VVGEIGNGLLILLGIAASDSSEELSWGIRKVSELRIFQDADEKMNLSLMETGGEALVVSQFTLLADNEKGRRPSFVKAAPPERAKPMYEEFVRQLRALGIRTATGIFGAKMSVSLVNEGPVTIVLERMRYEV
jgi:D-tyrosyl-tRNA(Tyr) deacylase